MSSFTACWRLPSKPTLLEPFAHYFLSPPLTHPPPSPQLEPVAKILEGVLNKTLLAKACQQCNEKNRAAQKADESSSRLFLGLLVRGRNVPAEAVVLSVMERYVSVFVPQFVFEQRVFFEDNALLGWKVSAADAKSSKAAVLRWPVDPNAPVRQGGPASEKENTVRQLRMQIEYYLSDRNLRVDAFLREEMTRTPDGSVKVAVLSGFNKIKKISTDRALIARAVNSSPILELSADGESVIKKKKTTLEVDMAINDDDLPVQLPSVEQTLHAFDVLKVTVDVRPDHFPLELKVKLVHPSL
jgi:hypothetical protein